MPAYQQMPEQQVCVGYRSTYVWMALLGGSTRIAIERAADSLCNPHCGYVLDTLPFGRSSCALDAPSAGAGARNTWRDAHRTAVLN